MFCEVATMTADDIINIQMKNLKKNNIHLAYELASPLNRLSTGPYQRFQEMIYRNYKPLLGYTSYKLIGKPILSNNNRTYTRDVKVRRYSKDKIINYIYTFQLSKQYDYKNDRPIIDPYTKICLNKYWRTDSVILNNTYNTEIRDKKGRKNKKHNEHFRGGKPSQKNVYNENLEICSTKPLTGFYRDGYCNTGPNDHGTHTVCAKVTDNFLKFSKRRGNDLISPSPSNNFPGLKDGDYWCLCANRYKEANENNIKMDVNKKASNHKTLEYMSLDKL